MINQTVLEAKQHEGRYLKQFHIFYGETMIKQYIVCVFLLYQTDTKYDK